MKRIAIFASGNGTNAERIMEYFTTNNDVKIELILSNNPDAGVLQRARKFDVQKMVFTREELYKSDKVVDTLLKKGIDFVILAGFLWLIPLSILKQFPDRIINIHPALLPKYGGKGMFGHHVHEAVITNKEKLSGITIHYVNEHYDEGNIIFQATCEISDDDTADSLASKIHELEYQHFPVVIEKLISVN
ncbi:MAG: phosphoribosylglycinamide formyltransferase [Marinilabiliales bacterium]|nr:MAG: phosphoribosylglycinamide formyltransferase [Marinilabiliales bacterium]